jgi:hypothetical protein
MPNRNVEIEGLLQSKFGFRVAKKGAKHRWIELQLPGVQRVRTCISHGRQTVGKDLEHKMAQQLRVTTPYFREMIGCTKNRADYYHLLQDMA